MRDLSRYRGLSSSSDVSCVGDGGSASRDVGCGSVRYDLGSSYSGSGSRSGWLVFGVLAGLFLFFSFLSWVVSVFLRHAELQAARAHELSLKALELSASRSDAADASDVLSGSVGYSPGYVVVGLLLFFGVVFVLRGLR